MHQLQRTLHQLQRSPHGVAVAAYLLAQPSPNCRYFGALTYAVVIQHAGADDGLWRRLYGDIVAHLRHAVGDTPVQLFVARKLMSDVAQLFFRNAAAIGDPVARFLADVLQVAAPHHQYAQLAAPHWGLVLMFFSVLAEDLLRWDDPRSPAAAAVHDLVFPHLGAAYHALGVQKQRRQLAPDLNMQALDTLAAWMQYMPNMRGDNQADADTIACLGDFILGQFGAGGPDDTELLALARQSMRVMNEVLEINAVFFPAPQRARLELLLLEDWGAAFVAEVAHPDARDEFRDELAAFVDLFISYSSSTLLRHVDVVKPHAQKVVAVAFRLTALAGVPLHDDLVSERMIEFWDDLASALQDAADMNESVADCDTDGAAHRRFVAERDAILARVADIYWQKCHLPPAAIHHELEAEFASYRTSVADLMVVIFLILQEKLYARLAEALVREIGAGAVADMEATLYLMGKINDDSMEFELQVAMLGKYSARVLDAGLLDVVSGAAVHSRHGRLLLSTAVDYLASNQGFFRSESGHGYLRQVFDVLFPIMMSGLSRLALAASRTAAQICEEASQWLVPALPNIEAVVLELLRNPDADSMIRLRMFTAYSVIARSIPDVAQHAGLVHGLVTALGEYASRAPHNEEYVLLLASCLVGVGKGCSLPDEVVEEMSSENRQSYQTFWAEDPLGVKPLILLTLRKLCIESPFSQSPLVVEKYTAALKVGMSDALGGPFTLADAEIAEHMVLAVNTVGNVNAAPCIFKLFETFICVRFAHLGVDFVGELTDSLFTERLAFVVSDLDIVSSAVDVFSKMLEKRPVLLLRSRAFGSVIDFAVQGLLANEVFVVKSTLRFWTTFLNLKKGSQEDQALVGEILVNQGLGQIVSTNLVGAFLRAPRSSLENYYSIFRALLAKHTLAFKSWFAAAIETASLNIDAKDLQLLSHKLLSTRGRRTANDVLKELWMRGNNMVEYNTQRGL